LIEEERINQQSIANDPLLIAKLALKEISRKIEHEEKLTTEDYFSRKYLQASNEINFVTFVQFFIKNTFLDKLLETVNTT
jgi:hypothetical protein